MGRCKDPNVNGTNHNDGINADLCTSEATARMADRPLAQMQISIIETKRFIKITAHAFVFVEISCYLTVPKYRYLQLLRV